MNNINLKNMLSLECRFSFKISVRFRHCAQRVLLPVSDSEEEMETETDAEGEALVQIYTQLRHSAK